MAWGLGFGLFRVFEFGIFLHPRKLQFLFPRYESWSRLFRRCFSLRFGTKSRTSSDLSEIFDGRTTADVITGQ